MSRKKTMTLFSLVAMVALLTLGLGYAAWNTDLKTDMTVQTGQFQVVWQGLAAPVGDCSPEISADKKTITVSMENAYPGKSCTVEAELQNVGSIVASPETINVTGDTSEIAVTTTVCSEKFRNLLPPKGNAVGDAFNCVLTFAVTHDAQEGSNHSVTVTIPFSLPSS